MKENLSPYEHIIDNTLLLLQHFQTRKVRHVKRNLNKTAHGLAKEAIKNSIDKIWMKEIPSCIFNTIDLELLTLVIQSLVALDFLSTISFNILLKKKKKHVCWNLLMNLSLGLKCIRNKFTHYEIKFTHFIKCCQILLYIIN